MPNNNGTTEHTCFSCPRGAQQDRSFMFHENKRLKRLNQTETIQCIFLDHNSIKIETILDSLKYWEIKYNSQAKEKITSKKENILFK
jgi:hypothetical protein